MANKLYFREKYPEVTFLALSSLCSRVNWMLRVGGSSRSNLVVRRRRHRRRHRRTTLLWIPHNEYRQ